ncbi:STAS domain-containing protein [Prauserella shujinwangii]|nr:STAS domain-containing protein [Prauserella shujinwangii]
MARSPMTGQGKVTITVDTDRDCLVVRPSGVLDERGYPLLRDTLRRCAAETPVAVIVDLRHLVIPSTAFLTVFTSVYVSTACWPAVPILLVACDVRTREWLRSSRITRIVPVHRALDEAVAAAGTQPERRRSARCFPREHPGGAVRRFVTATLAEWGVDQLAEDARLIVTELVENVGLHTGSEPRVRLELRGDVLTVAVSDDDPRPAELREESLGVRSFSGLRLVSKLACAWGNSPTNAGGKIVWATLRVRRDRSGDTRVRPSR